MATTKPVLFATMVVVKYYPDNDGDQRTYEMDVLTTKGVYYTRVQHNSLLYLNKIVQTSLLVCTNLDKSEFEANTIVSSLNQQAMLNYSELADHDLSLVQASISETAGVISYRLLYAAGNSRYELTITQSMGSYLISSITKKSGTGCSLTEVRVGGICLSSCDSFF